MPLPTFAPLQCDRIYLSLPSNPSFISSACMYMFCMYTHTCIPSFPPPPPFNTHSPPPPPPPHTCRHEQSNGVGDSACSDDWRIFQHASLVCCGRARKEVPRLRHLALRLAPHFVPPLCRPPLGVGMVRVQNKKSAKMLLETWNSSMKYASHMHACRCVFHDVYACCMCACACMYGGFPSATCSSGHHAGYFCWT